jgi:hypothetical protein
LLRSRRPALALVPLLPLLQLLLLQLMQPAVLPLPLPLPLLAKAVDALLLLA